MKIILKKIKTHPARLLSLSLANFALLLRQHITNNAKIGNPMMHETIGTTTDSGETIIIIIMIIIY